MASSVIGSSKIRGSGICVKSHLLILQRRLESGDGLAFVARKYLIEAQKGLPS